MAAIFSFKCSCCGEVHEGSPSFGFTAPDPFLEQSEQVQSEGHLTSDLCSYTDEDGTHYFARTLLEIPIHGVEEPFMWGVWVSLSKDSYDHYVETYDDPEPEGGYFGWLCNYLPFYESTYALATDVRPQSADARPCIYLHETDHQLYRDFQDGISVERAQEIAESCMHGS